VAEPARQAEALARLLPPGAHAWTDAPAFGADVPALAPATAPGLAALTAALGGPGADWRLLACEGISAHSGGHGQQGTRYWGVAFATAAELAAWDARLARAAAPGPRLIGEEMRLWDADGAWLPRGRLLQALLEAHWRRWLALPHVSFRPPTDDCPGMLGDVLEPRVLPACLARVAHCWAAAGAPLTVAWLAQPEEPTPACNATAEQLAAAWQVAVPGAALWQSGLQRDGARLEVGAYDAARREHRLAALTVVPAVDGGLALALEYALDWPTAVRALLALTGGRLPPELAPLQARVVALRPELHATAAELLAELTAAGLRAEPVAPGERLGDLVHQAHRERLPWLLTIGPREARQGAVTVRQADGTQVTLARGGLVAWLLAAKKSAVKPPKQL
jgi:hypothetical protein